MASKKVEASIDILELKTEQLTCCILGKTPIILYRMSQKVLQELLMPKGRKTTAEKATSLKHNPLVEFRASPYTLPEDTAETFLAHLSTAFKQSMASAALDIPGAKKAQISRLCFVEGERVPIFGIPKIFMAAVRSADMNRTPDIRTRCIVPEWACVLTITYSWPILKQPIIARLLAAGGIIQGVGDWRPSKGSGNFGQYEIVDPKDPRFVKIVKEGGRKAQIEAMKRAEPYDEETEELLSWFVKEAGVRGFKEVKESVA